MLDINFLKNSGLFELVSLEENQILFDEGDTDNNLYFIEKGNIIIEKKLSGESNKTKRLAVIGEGEIFGEGSLNNSDPKQVRVRAKNNTILLKIDAQKNIQQFLEKYPNEGLELFKKIIDLGNKRVLKANALITANYEMDQTISGLEDIDMKSIFLLLDKFKDIIHADYIVYIENNPVLDNYLTVKYDTRQQGKMQDIVIEDDSHQAILDCFKEEEVILAEQNYLIKLNIANMNLGYFMLGKQHEDFSSDEKKIINSISNSLAGVIRQQNHLEEIRDQEYMKE